MRFHGKFQSSAVLLSFLKLFLIFDNKRRNRWWGMLSRWIQDELESDGRGEVTFCCVRPGAAFVYDSSVGRWRYPIPPHAVCRAASIAWPFPPQIKRWPASPLASLDDQSANGVRLSRSQGADGCLMKAASLTYYEINEIHWHCDTVNWMLCSGSCAQMHFRFGYKLFHKAYTGTCE